MINMNGKIFAIGFNKTGTTSLHTLFKLLGYSSYHGTKWRGCDDLELLRSYNCFSDGIPKDLPKLDRLFPGSKFILQVRDLESWIYSRLAHIERRKKQGTCPVSPIWDTTEDAIKYWIKERNNYHLFVLSYFSKRRSDIIIINYIRDRFSSLKICDFLGCKRVYKRPFSNARPNNIFHVDHVRILNNCIADLSISEHELHYDIYCPSLVSNQERNRFPFDSNMIDYIRQHPPQSLSPISRTQDKDPNTRQDKESILSRIWHPYHGLWNRKLIRKIQRNIPIISMRSKVRPAIIYLDTIILFLRAIIIRISSCGLFNVFQKAQTPDHISIVYIDIGTHREGSEICLMVDEVLPQICRNFEAYGFEANHQAFEQVSKKLAHRENIQIIHKAITYLPLNRSKIKLFKDMSNGLGDSLHRRTAHYEEVEAMNLSSFLLERNLIKSDQIRLMRMNIEGAEYDVIRDLAKTKLVDHIDGYFGMWDDLYKIDTERDTEFRVFLAKHGIHAFTFNQRDLLIPLRIKCIIYHIHTQIMKGLHGRYSHQSSA